MSQIHPTAIIDSSATLAEDCEIGPYCVIGPNVEIGARTRLTNHVTVAGPSRIGQDNLFFPYDSIGQQSQDLKYEGEPTFLEIGDGNTFREFCTINRGTAPGTKTVIGNHGNFLAYSHIAHDCVVGDHVIFSNNGTLAGHVIVEDHTIVGGLAAVHQFCRLGKRSMLGGCTKIVQDVPPYFIADGNPAVVRGINVVGLERAGFQQDVLRALRECYRLLYRSNLNVKQAVEEIRQKNFALEPVNDVITFIEASQRGIVR